MVEKKVADTLKVVESRDGLSNAQRKSLVNNYSTPQQLYGLCKSHKSDTDKLVKHLASILQPLVGPHRLMSKTLGS